jgi:hypothetical protein
MNFLLKYNDYHAVNRKCPLVSSKLSRMMDLHDDEGMAGAMVKTMMASSHDGLIRSGESTNKLKVSKAVKIVADGVDVTLLRSKKYRTGKGETLHLKDYEGEYCGATMLRAWAPYAVECKDNVHGWLFPAVFIGERGRITGIDWSEAMSRKQLVSIVKSDAKRLGWDPRVLAGHSFRAGGATDLFAIAGYSIAYIMAVGRWKSVEAALVYNRAEEEAAKWAVSSFEWLYRAK